MDFITNNLDVINAVLITLIACLIIMLFIVIYIERKIKLASKNKLESTVKFLKHLGINITIES